MPKYSDRRKSELGDCKPKDHNFVLLQAGGIAITGPNNTGLLACTKCGKTIPVGDPE